MAQRCVPILLTVLLVLSGAAHADDAVDKALEEAKRQKAEKEAKPPEEAAARAEWIEKLTTHVREADAAKRRSALRMLVKHDKDGDTTTALVPLLSDENLSLEAQIDVVRALGIPAFIPAVEPLLALLESDNASLRGNAAVSLEYIGSYLAIDALKKRMPKEKVRSVRGHMCRALGRCGAGQRPVRSALLKELGRAKTDEDTMGPLIALAYFERDSGTARKLEKKLAKLVVPKGTNALASRRRARLMGWVLSEIADAKTPKFLRDKVMPRLKATSSIAVVSVNGGEADFYESVARKIEGDPSAAKNVDGVVGDGAGRIVDAPGAARAIQSVGGLSIATMDDMRKGRDMSAFRPKGDHASVLRGVLPR